MAERDYNSLITRDEKPETVFTTSSKRVSKAIPWL